MSRQSALFLPVVVITYVAVVNSLAALFVYASIKPHESHLSSYPVWASLVARSYCRYRQIGFSELTSRDRAIRDHDAWREQVLGGGLMAAKLIELATAEVCPRHRLGAGQLP